MVRRPAVSLVLALLVVVPGCGFAGIDFDDIFDSKGSGGPPGPTMSGNELAEAMAAFQATNAARLAAGVPPVAWHDAAAQVGYEHCADMRIRAFFSHLNPDGQWPTDRLRAARIANWTMGENIHWRSSPSGAHDAVGAFMNSPPHRATLLNAGFTHVGIGMHSDGDRSWWTQVFLTPR